MNFPSICHRRWLNWLEYWRKKQISDKRVRLNGNITASEVRLIDENGEQSGIKSLEDALAQAKAATMDLVEISPNAKPPVCKILNYDKYRYEQRKRTMAGRKNQKKTQIKELKYSVRIEEGDYQVRLRNLIRFLGHGDKVKISLRFRGREMAHQQLGVQLLERIQLDVEPYADVESKPKLEGRQMIMLVSPKKKVVSK